MITPQYKIKSFIMESGERYCLLTDKKTGMPLYYPNLYVTTQVRNASKATATMEAALVGINVFLTFCIEKDIDLLLRFQKREFFAAHEMDAFRDYCQKNFNKVGVDTHGSIAGITGKEKRKPSLQAGLATEYIRLTHAARYSEWLAKILLPKSKDRKTILEIGRMKEGFLSRRPSKKRRNQERREKGLDKNQVAILLEIINPASEFNPFEEAGVQARNRLLILLLLHLGARGGEVLNIRASDIDWSRNQIILARRADEKSDPRREQPLLKTNDRRIPLKDTLIEEIRQYITKYRNKVPNARRHDYLLVTHKSGPTQGQPMSVSSYRKVIKVIASAVPDLFDLHGHELRHTWNNDYSELMDSMEDPPSPEEQEKNRSYLQGWKEGSGTAAFYTKRFNREKANEASLKLQEGQTRIPRNLIK